MKSLVYLVLICSASMVSCSPQHLITGEPMFYGIDPGKRQLFDRDTLDTATPNLVIPHKGEIVALVLNTTFIKYLKDVSSPHVLVYAQVFDDGTDNAETAITKVLYNERNSPPDVNLALADRVLYGPTPFKGFPLRIKFFVVELDKEQKELASRIIDTVGTAVAAAKPEAAPAIATAVAIAKGINAMNEDDFELRFDLTLFPIAATGKASTGSERPDVPGEHGKSLAIVSPLRTGSYAIMKRELPERFRAWWRSPTSEISALDMDYSQETFVSDYVGADGKNYQANEVLRYEGGYLYRIVTDIKESNSQGTKTSVESAVVRPRSGPNRSADVLLVKDQRQRFLDRTYVVLSVVTGLPLGLEPDALRATSERDARQLEKLLDNSSDASLAARIGPEVEALAASLKSTLEQRRIAAEATRRVGRDPSFRTSPDYALFWVQQIDPLTAADGSVRRRNAEAKNAAILEALAEIIVNLPILNPAEEEKMTKLYSLTATDLETVTDKPGIFRLNDQGKGKL
ncbi:MAG: hypothetical protein GDA68_03850 [Nitrospira sp. CR2.1]|nr:hypothetical protein [Nitrospira sp. CR2.1]